MRLRKFDYAQDHHRWDEFIRTHANGTFFHLSGWHQVIAQSYQSFEPCYWCLEDANRLVAVLPATLVRRPFVGTALISNPFSVSAGPLCSDGVDTEQFLQMIEAEHANADYIELRDCSMTTSDRWELSEYFVNFEKKLANELEENWLAIPNRQRAVIRKAEKENLTLEHHEDIERFLAVYAVSLRNLGTPIYPLQFFEALLSHFSESICLVTVTTHGRDLTTVLCFKYQGRLMPYYGGGLPDARNYHAYPWMYWQLMQYGVDHEMPTFDFGRSPQGSGPYAFKKNLGFKPRKLPYAYLPLQGQVPDLSGTSSLAKLLIGTWQKLPVPVTRILGPSGAIYAV